MSAPQPKIAGLLDWDWEHYDFVLEFFLDEDEQRRREEFRSDRRNYRNYIHQRIIQKRKRARQERLEEQQASATKPPKRTRYVVEDSQSEGGELSSSDQSDHEESPGQKVKESQETETAESEDDMVIPDSQEFNLGSPIRHSTPKEGSPERQK